MQITSLYSKIFRGNSKSISIYLYLLDNYQQKQTMRHFQNPYSDFSGGNVNVDRNKIIQLIGSYVDRILQNREYGDGDLYVGTSGIAFMFLKLHKSSISSTFKNSLSNAKIFIDHAKKMISRKDQDKASFLCGNAGIYAVSAIINYELKDVNAFVDDKKNYLEGYPVCKKISYNRYGSDEILFGRAGYLSGIYWINQNVQKSEGINDVISDICNVMLESGLQYSKKYRLSFPLMYECYNDRYMGAAHGVCAILHMFLESSLFAGNPNELNEVQKLIKTCTDLYLQTQTVDGNFPCVLEDAGKSEHKLVHWCHGASGAVYLFAKAYLIFKDERYLNAVIKAGDLMWQKGLLRKGPGICHGVAGNGYVFLLLYRLTNDLKHLHRAYCFADFLTNETFLREARTPDRPLSLYEGISGTICYLIDLMEPQNASFPFMDVFDCKY